MSACIAPVNISSFKPRLFVLLIGINVYQWSAFPRLRGAVPDVFAFRDYFTSYLQVPHDRIRTLIEEKASRSAIIRAFQDIQNDPRIERGDPIFIFFAGHGGEMSPPAGWEAGGEGAKIQFIIPQDYCVEPGQRQVHGIPDYTLQALLRGIADSKGNIITVFLDCCHAASGTRGGNEDISETLIRSVELNCPIPENLDEDIWDTRSRGMRHQPIRYQNAGLNSHVLFAACGASELAKETRGHGEFSKAFLALLRKVGPDRLRCSEVLSRMDKISCQNPQCEGENQNRYLFNGMVAPSTRRFYDIQRQNDGSLVLKAGAAIGLTERAMFAIYPDMDSIHEQPMSYLFIQTLSSFSSIMALPAGASHLPAISSAVAVQTAAGVNSQGNLLVYIHPEERDLSRLVKRCIATENDLSSVFVTDQEQDAHLVISLIRGKVVFRVADCFATRHGLRQRFSPIDFDARHISYILGGVAQFYRLLGHTNPNSQIDSKTQVRVEFRKLVEPYGSATLVPVGNNLCKENQIEFVVDDSEDSVCGMKLINHSPHNLFPTVFYLDNADFTVELDYQPPTSGSYNTDVPLKKNGGSITIGYGSAGASPKTYPIRQGHDVEVGYFKILLSTTPLGDLSHMNQVSPFVEHRGRGSYQKMSMNVWDTLVIPTIFRRNPDRSNRVQNTFQKGAPNNRNKGNPSRTFTNGLRPMSSDLRPSGGLPSRSPWRP